MSGKNFAFRRLFFLRFQADKYDDMKRLFKNVAFSLIFGGISLAIAPADTVHIVKKGETLYSISRLYGVSVDAIRDANGLSGNNVRVDQKLSVPDPAPAQAAESAEESAVHIVQKGETLYSISRLYDRPIDDIKAVNGLSGNNVMVGQKLSIPPLSSGGKNSAPAEKKDAQEARAPQKDIYYVVERGDSWLGIARDHGLSFSEILALNNADENTMLRIGQRVKVVNVPDLDDPHMYDTKKGDSSLVWPVKASEVTYVSGKVNGVMLSAKKNEPVKSLCSGTVLVSGVYRGFGNVVFVRSKSGLIYSYSGLGRTTVSKGDVVNSGAEIGTAGIDRFRQQPCVYLMVFQDERNIDPAKAPRG